MNYLIFTTFLLILFYSVRYRPGIYLVYILFFLTLNQSIFQAIGLDSIRNSILLLIFPLYYFHQDKVKLSSKLSIFFKNKIIIGYFLLLLYTVIYGYYIGTYYELNYIRLFLMPGIILILISGLFIYNEEVIKQMFFGVLIFSALMYLYMIFITGIAVGIERQMLIEYYSMSIITMARIAGLSAIFSVMLILNIRGIDRYLYIAMLLISLLMMSYMGTRGPIIALIVTILFAIIFSRGKINMLRNVAIIVILSVLFLLEAGFAESVLFERMHSLFNPEEVMSMYRYERYLLFYHYLRDYYLFGMGPGGWGRYVMIGEYRHPHNLFMEFLIEFGVIGLTSFLLIAVKGFSTVISITISRYSSYYLKAMSIGWVYYFINTMFSGSFIFGNQIFFIYSALLVGIDYIHKNNRNYALAINELNTN